MVRPSYRTVSPLAAASAASNRWTASGSLPVPPSKNFLIAWRTKTPSRMRGPTAKKASQARASLGDIQI